MKKIRILLWIMLFNFKLLAYSLPYDLSEQLATIPLSENSYSIYVKALNSPSPLVSLHARRARTPASVVKILTTYSALLALGYEYRWETKFYYTGRIKKGVLRGNLIIEASGDPTLKTEDLDEIVLQLKEAGIRRIVGNIVIDRSLFKVSTKNNSGFDKNRYSPYNAMPDAMMFNERKSKVCLSMHGKRSRLTKDIPDLSYKVVNKVKVVNGSCRGKRSWPRVRIRKNVLTFSGRISRYCGKRNVCKVITKPYLSFYYALKGEMKKNKISFRGKLKLQHKSKHAKYLFSHYSAPLEEVISSLTKHSNNLYARQVMLTVGAKVYGKPSTIYKGREGIERILERYQILEGKTFIENGSGLSRKSKLTAKTLANLLEHAALHYGQRWMETLSIAGIDGTIKRRFANSIVYGRAWMKTGTIRNVANISGYVEGNSGERYVVVVLVNDKLASKYGKKLANTVIEWVVEKL